MPETVAHFSYMLRVEYNGWHFANGIFNCIFLKKNYMMIIQTHCLHLPVCILYFMHDVHKEYHMLQQLLVSPDDKKEDIRENHQRAVEEHGLRGLMWAQCNNFTKEELSNWLEIQFKHGMYSKMTNLAVWQSISTHSILWCVIIHAGPSYLVMAHLIVSLWCMITCISTCCLHDMERQSSMLAFC